MLATVSESRPLKRCCTRLDNAKAHVYNSQPFLVYIVNIRCLLANIVELTHHINIIEPHLVLIQENWLNASVEEIALCNYSTFSRRDCAESENRNGVITFVRNDIRNTVHVSHSVVAERSWHDLHSDLGTIALCN